MSPKWKDRSSLVIGEKFSAHSTRPLTCRLLSDVWRFCSAVVGLLHWVIVFSSLIDPQVTIGLHIVSPAERLRIVGLISVIIVLIAALIIVGTRSTSCDCNNDVGGHRTITPAAEITDIKIEKSAPCEDYWIWFRGKCYYFSTERDTWRNSEKFCISHNSSLAIIESKEELDFLFRYKSTDNHWIGMRRTDDNTAWIWTDGSLYNESLSRIRRSSHENIEYVYLNSRDVGSDGGNFHYNWICNKK